jgi:hypothetical protein
MNHDEKEILVWSFYDNEVSAQRYDRERILGRCPFRETLGSILLLALSTEIVNSA